MNRTVLNSNNLSANGSMHDDKTSYNIALRMNAEVKAPSLAGDLEIYSLRIGQHQFATVVSKIECLRKALKNKQQSCLVFILKGRIELFSETEALSVVAAEQAVFVENAHRIASVKQLDKTEPFKACLILFDEDTLRSFCFQEGIVQKEAKPTAFFLPIDVSDNLHSYLDSITFLINQKQRSKSKVNLIKLKAIELLYLIYGSNDDIQLREALVSYKNPNSHRIQKIMESNFCENLTIKQFAYMCSMSESSFKRKFSSIYGLSPNLWIRKKRLALARKLLLTTDEVVSEICLRVGFRSLSYFFQAFKNEYSLTPTEIRSNKILSQ